VERLEQKRKMHEGCAQVVTTIEELETQQKLILGRCTENSSLMEEMKQNMDENLEVSKANLELLKAK
jgi:K+/H+ antiporter YhaU regulatory subunit KhtT